MKNKKIFFAFVLLSIIFLNGCSNEVNEDLLKNNQISSKIDKIIDNSQNIDEQGNVGGEANLCNYEYNMITSFGCYNNCGDEICDVLSCLDYNCVCKENKINCPYDC